MLSCNGTTGTIGGTNAAYDAGDDNDAGDASYELVRFPKPFPREVTSPRSQTFLVMNLLSGTCTMHHFMAGYLRQRNPINSNLNLLSGTGTMHASLVGWIFETEINSN